MRHIEVPVDRIGGMRMEGTVLAASDHEEEKTLLLQLSGGRIHLLDTNLPTSGQVAGTRRDGLVPPMARVATKTGRKGDTLARLI